MAELKGLSESLRGNLPAVEKDHRPGPQASWHCLCFLFDMVLSRQNKVHLMWEVPNVGQILED